MKKSYSSLSHPFYTMGIIILFIGGFLALTVFGATSYRNMMLSNKANDSKRRILAYLNTSLTQERCRSVRIDRGSEGDILVIEDGDTGYADRIYVHEGKLVEDYGESQGPLIPEDAIAIGDTSSFDARISDDGIIYISTDAGLVRVALYGREAG